MQNHFDAMFDLIDNTIDDNDLESVKKKLMLISYNLGLLALELEVSRNKENMQ